MKKERHQGHKPPVAFANQAAAKLNIESKRDLIVLVVARQEQAAPKAAPDSDRRQRVLAALPKSLAEFNRWSSDTADWTVLGESRSFRVNAHETLRQSGVLESVQSAIDAVKAARLRPDPVELREGKLAELRRRMKASEQLRAIAEESVRKSRSELNALQKGYDALELRLDAAHREAARLLAAKKAAPTAAKGTVSQLRPKKGS